MALGLADRIVDVSDYCPDVGTKPPPVRVGGLNNLNVEAVLALHPDLVMSVQNPGDRTLVALADRGVALYTDDPSLPQVFASIEAIGELPPRRARRELTARLRERLARVAAAHAGSRARASSSRSTRRVVGVGGARSCATPSSRGGDNLFDDVESPYPTVSEEAVAAAIPTGSCCCTGRRLRAARPSRACAPCARARDHRLDRDLLLPRVRGWSTASGARRKLRR
jgi:ABC-type Fe3+-hydroxamate transport system substrate-binding protein